MDAVEQMLKQSGRNILAADLRHVLILDSGRPLDPIESARETLFDACRFDGIGGSRELLG
jgi:hypothetical protein